MTTRKKNRRAARWKQRRSLRRRRAPKARARVREQGKAGKRRGLREREPAPKAQKPVKAGAAQPEELETDPFPFLSELSRGQVTLRDMTSGQQTTLPSEGVVAALVERLGA